MEVQVIVINSEFLPLWIPLICTPKRFKESISLLEISWCFSQGGKFLGGYHDITSPCWATLGHFGAKWIGPPKTENPAPGSKWMILGPWDVFSSCARSEALAAGMVRSRTRAGEPSGSLAGGRLDVGRLLKRSPFCFPI